MAQNREKEETVELQVTCCSDPCKIPPKSTAAQICAGSGSDPEREPEGTGSGHEEGRGTEKGESGPLDRGSDEAGDGDDMAVAGKRKAVNRCSGCRKRVGLTGFRCRCGEMFCWEHRYSDRHDCSYDYKAAGRAAIARENPVVRASKLLKV